MTKPDLDQLRQQIDQTDTELVELIARRMQLAQQVGQLKSQAGQPLYVPEREAALLSRRRAQADSLGLAPAMVEDVLRRIMRESYLQQRQQGFDRTGPPDRRVVIMGSEGQFGQLLQHWFSISGYPVVGIDQHNQDELSAAVQGAILVLVAVPIEHTVAVISQLPDLPADCVLADVTSVKQEPLTAMLEAHSGPVLGLHPMFGPAVPTLAKQLVIVTPGREATAANWLLEQFALWGCRLTELSAPEHDKAMSMIQVMRHFSSFVYGYHLREENVELDTLLQLSSPIYRLELMMVGRLFAQNPRLYADIIYSDAAEHATMERYLERFREMLDLLQNEGKEGFVRQFEEVAQWFGDHSENFLAESTRLLAHAEDGKT